MSEGYDIVLRFSRRYAMGHRLISGAAPACKTPHGHDEVVIVDIASATNDTLDSRTNMLVEFEQAKGRWFRWIDKHVDHTFHISDRDPLVDFFQKNEPDIVPKLLITPGDPTTELRAACYFAKLTAFLNSGGQDLICTRIELQETPTNSVVINSGFAPGGDHWWNRPDLDINDL